MDIQVLSYHKWFTETPKLLKSTIILRICVQPDASNATCKASPTIIRRDDSTKW